MSYNKGKLLTFNSSCQNFSLGTKIGRKNEIY